MTNFKHEKTNDALNMEIGETQKRLLFLDGSMLAIEIKSAEPVNAENFNCI